MVAAMKPGLVIVYFVAEGGGKCEVTQPGKMIVHKSVNVIRCTDFPSRLPTQASSLYSNSITKFFLSMALKDKKIRS